MQEPGFGVQRPPSVQWERAVIVMLSMLAVWLFYLMTVAALSQNVHFDGAMNLEVSRSLAEGTGPRRLYDFTDYFPHGVQTKEPYTLLGALIFKLFGVGPFTAQLPSLIYLLMLCIVMLLVVRRLATTATGLLAVILLLSMPRLREFGLNGYGEIPTLTFGLAALGTVCWPGNIDNRLWLRAALAGLFAGLAIATKVVAAILVVAIAMTLIARIFFESKHHWRSLSVAATSYAAFLVFPPLLVELWKWLVLGKASYIEWWQLEWQYIGYQAGIDSELVDHVGIVQSRTAKIANHFMLLTGQIRRSWIITGLMFVVPLVYGACVVFLRYMAPRSRWLVFGLLLVGGCYLVWWMAITPTEKAYLRRIYIGLVCLGTISAIALDQGVRWILKISTRIRRTLLAAFAACILCMYMPFVYSSLRYSAVPQQSEDVKMTLEAAELVRRMSPDDLVFGYGWYAAPSIALYSGRELIDLLDWPIGRYPGHHAYLLADSSTFVTHTIDRMLERYPHQALLQDNSYAQVYEINFDRPNNPFADTDQSMVTGFLTFSEKNFGLTYGMESFDKNVGGRWIESDAEVLLKYQGQRNITVKGYMAPPSYYRFGVPLQGRVLIPGCPGKPFAFTGTDWRTFEFSLEDCQLPSNENIRIRLLLDNAFDPRFLHSNQRAMLLSEIGFR